MEKPQEQAYLTKESLSSTDKLVLLIDDNIDLLESTRAFLELEGFKVLTASGGEEALNVLGEITQPDLILLDMKMQDMSVPSQVIDDSAVSHNRRHPFG